MNKYSNKFTPEKVEVYEKVVKDKFRKVSAKVISKELGISYPMVYTIAKRLGLYKDGNLERAQRNTSCNIHYFDEWSDNMAYILGYLFADGSVGSRGIRLWLSETDLSVIEYVKNEVDIKSNMVHCPARGTTNESVYIDMVSVIITRKLAELGLHPSKTYANHPFPDVPEQYLPHFIRGYFDGDGTAKMDSIGFIGTPDFIIKLREILVNKVGMSEKKITTTKGKRATWSSLAWERRSDMRKFRDFVYPGGFSFCLERKKKRIDDWLNKEHNREFSKPYRERIPWTKEEDDKLKELYHVLGPKKLAAVMGKDGSSLRWRASKIGIKPIDSKIRVMYRNDYQPQKGDCK